MYHAGSRVCLNYNQLEISVQWFKTYHLMSSYMIILTFIRFGHYDISTKKSSKLIKRVCFIFTTLLAALLMSDLLD